ncbi:hypothetical protein OS175_01295 [Marinicella sp. S1101]|uniref:hypothetical protein n=1 Tax=Marinicella marina TaxID=2996016 RepID=UPI00226087C2|nr:hypothetical protein [Marinicella marina]MCX7552497.1 hypothetical protein [Marinicella marina]MDJ1139373.1 hypothetical protein [Marinicella marina]
MTHIIESPKLHKTIDINPEKNAAIKNLQRKLVALSFSTGNQSKAYQETLNQIKDLRKAKGFDANSH